MKRRFMGAVTHDRYFLFGGDGVGPRGLSCESWVWRAEGAG